MARPVIGKPNLIRHPRIWKPTRFAIPSMSMIRLDNGLPVYLNPSLSGDVIKLDWLTKSGRSAENIPMASRMTAMMLREGSQNKKGIVIDEIFDSCGSNFRSSPGMDYNSLGFTCLSEYFETLAALTLEVVTHPAFNEEDLKRIKENSASKLRQDLMDADFVTYRIITELIFGPSHPYGYNSSETTINNFRADGVKSHWQSNYYTNADFLILSGCVSEKHLQCINRLMGQKTLNSYYHKPYITPEQPPGQLVTLDHMNKNQCSIKIGHRTITRFHEDNTKMYILNTIIGGYFNSRLNMELRERKGLTYGINSYFDTYLHDGLFYISAETQKDHKEKFMKSVYQQVEKLRQEKVRPGELKHVKSYLLGNVLNSFDGIFNTSELLRSSLSEGVDFESNQNFIDTIHSVTSEDILDCAGKHLKPELFSTVVVS